jgi:hypothetical protein
MNNNILQDSFSKRAIYMQKYKNARATLLMIVSFTAINLLLLITNSNIYFLFSAFFPCFITTIGMFLCGRFPVEYYNDTPEIVFLNDSFFVIMLVIAVLITLLYLLSWFMTRKNRVGWLIFSLVIFGLDTLGMLLINGFHIESIMDILFHGVILYYISLGICAHYKYKKFMNDDETTTICENVYEVTDENEADNPENIANNQQDSPILRKADPNVKHRVLLKTRIFNYEICYRRVKHTNELVINGNVYDELEGVIEFSHILRACIDGHCFIAGFNGTHSFISVDGQEIAKKIRIF